MYYELQTYFFNHTSIKFSVQTFFRVSVDYSIVEIILTNQTQP